MKQLCLDKFPWNKMQKLTTHILLVNNPIQEANEYYQRQNPQNCRIFCAEELSIEISREIIDESYIAADGEKIILIAANAFNVYAQNALLKILEEPPKQVYFILFAKMKSQLLPTIRSRMPIFNHTNKEKMPNFPLNVETLSLREIYTFLKDKAKDYISNATTLKTEIQSLYLDSINAGLQFNQEEMQMFEEALLWAGQHEKAYNIFCVLLLMISNKKRQKMQGNIQ